MATVNQLIRKPQQTEVRKTDVPALEKSHNEEEVVPVVYTTTPKAKFSSKKSL